MVNKVLCVIC